MPVAGGARATFDRCVGRHGIRASDRLYLAYMKLTDAWLRAVDQYDIRNPIRRALAAHRAEVRWSGSMPRSSRYTSRSWHRPVMTRYPCSTHCRMERIAYRRDPHSRSRTPRTPPDALPPMRRRIAHVRVVERPLRTRLPAGIRDRRRGIPTRRMPPRSRGDAGHGIPRRPPPARQRIGEPGSIVAVWLSPLTAASTVSLDLGPGFPCPRPSRDFIRPRHIRPQQSPR